MGKIGRPVRIGTRDSQMALVQAERVRSAILANNMGLSVCLIPIKSKGDLYLNLELDGKHAEGIFTDEVSCGLMEDKFDICVHSLKDLPYEDVPELPIISYLRRDDPRDVLLLPKSDERFCGQVGCSSGRRRIQLKNILPDAETKSIRGSVPSRIEQMNSGLYDGLVLAMAGLVRLRVTGYPMRVFGTDEVMPAAGQGTIAVQCRKDDTEIHKMVMPIDDKTTGLVSRIERGLEHSLIEMGAEVSAAFAECIGEEIKLMGMIGSSSGEFLVKETAVGTRADAESLSDVLVRKLIGGVYGNL